MPLFRRVLGTCANLGSSALAVYSEVDALPSRGWKDILQSDKRELLQDLVTWDEHSLFVRGERIFFYSGEFRPFRLPSPPLWRDLFQKVRALGYNGVSFYVDWALLEGNPGHFTAEGVFAFEPFFEAATEAGIYLLARPGPYVNAEISGGGFPGWLARNPAILRTNESAYVDATRNYVSKIGAIVAKAQITDGGPVILVQPENEYTDGATNVLFPDIGYQETVLKQYRDAGIVVPLINNEAYYKAAFWVPGTPGGVDISGHDLYPSSLDCKDSCLLRVCLQVTDPNHVGSQSANWTASQIYTDLRTVHLGISPNTPFAIAEFQGGAPEYWGTTLYDQCAALIGPEFERVFQKNNFAAGMTIFNIYMTYGGTNWGNLGQPGGPTSYDYAAAIKEDRTVWGEKYSEAKLEAQFFAVSPAYLTANAANSTEPGIVSSADVVATPLYGNKTNIYVVRQADFRSLAATTYKLMAKTSIGAVSVPRMGGSLTLNGRDSKIHVTDYDVGGINLIYSSAEVFTWQKSGSKSVLVLYGGAGETHEFAVSSALGGVASVEGAGAKHEDMNGTTTANFTVGPARRVVHFGHELDVYLLWRNDAYNYWVPYAGSATATSKIDGYTKSSMIVAGGYLLRGASVTSSCIYLYGDINATTTFEIIAGQPGGQPEVLFNDKAVPNVKYVNGRVSATVPFKAPLVSVPDFAKLEWHYLDTLPEIKPTYDDAKWTVADLSETYNTAINSTTPTSLFSSDYGYEAGALLYRGHFTANGVESTFNVTTQGGGGFAHAIWLTSPQGGFGSRFLGAYVGNGSQGDKATVTLPALEQDKRYTLTIVIDHMGTEANWTPGLDLLKTPRGILNYTLSGHLASDVSWKITGNLSTSNTATKLVVR
ncbi:hypothetical protein LTR49_026381 [Elasticomyces elasticus]|nr:hypothetical protein LTR49_026381 [Elasticomyces elasticus]